ncbi:LuxR C-terminal-related transcriptional regulator [Streptomyces melanosporofaciens]|uniref:LuxR C-terminal-related transcriptional regulator n=1 Tax=Streptomyces sp. CY1 TaxID=3388313 RepID=UPI0039A3539A
MVDIARVTAAPSPDLLTSDNCAVLFVDHQPQMFFGTASGDRTSSINSTLGPAKAAKAFDVPAVLSTVAAESFSGPILPQLADVFPSQKATFTHDFRPAPVHYHASLYYLGDLAAAAVRAERVDDARTVVDAVERHLKPDPSPRLAAVLHRAAALLTDTDDVEHHFRTALEDPATDCWPFEKALARLDFGEWLRRRRRSAEARPHLNAALECFQRLDARPWANRTAAELRAAGAPAGTAATPASELTAQERQIAGLAAQGLTNRAIAARLYLSPRTVGYHLHKIFPKLGIRARAQLRDALSRDPQQ